MEEPFDTGQLQAKPDAVAPDGSDVRVLLRLAAPSGSGTVTVTVTGAGGTSASTRSSRYKYT